jgi:hypothetical protein
MEPIATKVPVVLVSTTTRLLVLVDRHAPQAILPMLSRARVSNVLTARNAQNNQLSALHAAEAFRNNIKMLVMTRVQLKLTL